MDLTFDGLLTLAESVIISIIIISFFHISSIKIGDVIGQEQDNKGVALDKLSEYKQAIIYFDKLLAIIPNNVDTLYDKANAVARLGGVIDPAVYEKSFLGKTDYSGSAANIVESISTNASNNLEESIRLYDRALSISPDDVDILVNKGIALLKLGKYTEANQIFDQCLNIDPEHAGCLYNKGMVLEALGKVSEANEYKNKAQEIDPTYPGGLINKLEPPIL